MKTSILEDVVTPVKSDILIEMLQDSGYPEEKN